MSDLLGWVLFIAAMSVLWFALYCALRAVSVLYDRAPGVSRRSALYSGVAYVLHLPPRRFVRDMTAADCAHISDAAFRSLAPKEMEVVVDTLHQSSERMLRLLSDCGADPQMMETLRTELDALTRMDE